MAEVAFPSEQGYHLQLQKFSEPPVNPENEHWYNASSSTDDSASGGTYNLNPPSISDDIAIRHEPSRYVDYLSHDWREDDTWSSWTYIVSNGGLHEQSPRFENALWRAWAKSKYNLKAIPPENINWLKDSDDNSLYGPLQSFSNSSPPESISEPVSEVSKPKCFLNKKSILKKQSMSELTRQKLMSVSPMLKWAGGVQVHRNASMGRPQRCPVLDITVKDFVTFPIRSKSVSREATDRFSSPRTSGLQPLDHSDRKLLRFDERVEQFRAVNLEDGQRDWAAESGDDSSDGGLLMRIPLKKSRFPQNKTRRNSNLDTKIIAKLPPTTLKSHSSSTQKTLSQSHPSIHSLLDNRGDIRMSSVQLSKFLEAPDDFVATYDGGTPQHRAKRPPEITTDMSIPFKDDQDDAVAAGLFDKLINALHLGKDIAQKIWNDSWLQFLKRLFIQCQSILLAVFGASERP